MMKQQIIVLLLAILVFCGCDNKKEPAFTQMLESEKKPALTLEPKNIVMIIAPKDFRDEELFEPKKIFEEKGAKVSIASITRDTAKGMLGGTVTPDLKISEVIAGDYDAVVIVGGVGAKEYLWENTELRTLIDDAYKKNKVIGAICLSSVVLARAGILKDKKATVYHDEESINELKVNGAIYVDERVIVSDSIITARDPQSAKDFALKILLFLTK